ncbi:MAG: glycosyltransferase family 2 protein, partial [Verrucomicrobiota bacterium]
VVEGEQETLRSAIDHDDRKPLSRWSKSQYQYAILEAEKLEKEERPAGLPDRMRKWILPAAPLTLIYTLFVKLAILDGWAGWFYAFQRTYAELLLSLILLERKVRDRGEG